MPCYHRAFLGHSEKEYVELAIMRVIFPADMFRGAVAEALFSCQLPTTELQRERPRTGVTF